MKLTSTSNFQMRLPLWLNLLGRVDALNSLANHAYNNPGYCYPSVSDGEPVFEAAAMGHPLIPGQMRICNDFSIRGKGIICIITGANMAGKSTFLRTVAVNMILGMTGAPVCAGSMRLAPVRLFTSMRTVDSLSHNESYFYAELKRLKILKERLEKGENIFFVLDEILKRYIDEHQSRVDLLAAGFAETVVDQVISLVGKAEFDERSVEGK